MKELIILIIFGLLVFWGINNINQSNNRYNQFVKECEAKKGVVAVKEQGFFVNTFGCYILSKEEIQNLLK